MCCPLLLLRGFFWFLFLVGSRIWFGGILLLMVLFTYEWLEELCIVQGEKDKAFFSYLAATYSFSSFFFSLAVLRWIFGYQWCLVLKRILHDLPTCLWSSCWDSWHLFIDYLQVYSIWVHFWRILGTQDVGFFTLPPPLMFCFSIGGSVPLLWVIFESFFLVLFYGKFGRLVMLLGSIPNLSLSMQLSIGWSQI